ncbi:hypothetical protein CFN78_03155 [Amycolatopsis antarctica]|uniref:Winged helix DNA-binding domain-containing protein n=1 Tax=Amycolatopsis antarctica TaxID=1854586 RepID=A0A263D9I4_9PSEU|nr:crosslink repair DNA glycosylase YcaQ family protein [Amycolatopsis antarctica]OZM75174.1 hypothetical protein CFN78_03155 [Amycolatopsis antarctica]
MLTVDRAQVLAHRIAAQGLHRTETDPHRLAVLDLGVQDNQRDSAALALAARCSGEVTGAALDADPRFTLSWTHRGAPHVHRTADMPGLPAALLPLSEADAQARMGWQRGRVAEAGMPAARALLEAARALRTVVTAPMTKGAVSTEMTRSVPAGLAAWCRPCGAIHVHEQLMRLAGIHAGVRLEPGVTPAVLAPLAGRGRVRSTPAPAAATAVVRAYLALHGPAARGDAAGFVGTAAGAAAPMWPEGLVEVRAAGRRTFIAPEHLAALENPPEPGLVRLLPPLDPFLQARDRETLLPEKAHRAEVWRILGNPGALLVDGEIAGTWRAKASGTRLDITISPLWTLARTVRSRVEEEAGRVSAARGYARHTVTG